MDRNSGKDVVRTKALLTASLSFSNYFQNYSKRIFSCDFKTFGLENVIEVVEKVFEPGLSDVFFQVLRFAQVTRTVLRLIHHFYSQSNSGDLTEV
jgi:hypothetical protein